MAHKKTAIFAWLCLLGLTATTAIWLSRGWAGKASQHKNIAAGIDLYESSYEKRGQENIDIYAVVIDPDQARLLIISQVDLTSETALDFIAFAQQHNALAMINGGYFDHTFQPVGLLIQNGVQVAGVLEQPPLSAAIVVYKSGSIQIVPATDYSHSPDQLAAIQAGPYLIDPGGVPGIYSDDFKRAKRSAIGLANNGQIVFLTTSPCTLFQLSEILSTDPQAIGVNAFECVVNLDGGPSSGLYLQDQPTATRPSKDPVPNAIVVQRK